MQTDADRAEPRPLPLPPALALAPETETDPGLLMRVCANCGATMEERKCKLICRGCGYFMSCADYV